jgi:ABC-type Fe3+ transport system permease subunit
MRTITKQRAGTIAMLLLAGTVALWLLVHMTSGQQHGCTSQSVDKSA